MFPFRFDKEDRPWFLVFAVLALLEAALVLAVSWQVAGSHFMLPLDDSYIHLQYARMMASGQPLVYTEGMAPSGGMTSPLYVMMLTPFLFFGLGGAKGAFVAYLCGTACWMLLPIWTYQLVKRLSNGLCGAIAAGLVLANGHLLWNFLSGMETAIYTLLIVGALLGAQAWWQSEHVHGRLMLVGCLALLPLARPEGAAFIVLALVLLLLRRGDAPRVSLVTVLLTVLPLVAWLAILKMGTGDWRPAGLIVKGLASHPYLTASEKVGQFGETLAAIATRFYFNMIPDPGYAAFKGTQSMPYIPPGTGLLASFGAGLFLVGEWRSGRLAGGSFLALGWLVGLGTIGASGLPFIHQQRYLAPYTVLAISLAIAAVWRVAQLFQQREELVLRAAGFALLLFSLPSVLFWTGEYGRNSRDIYHVLRVATFALEGDGTPVAITDAGVLAYYTRGSKYDLVGLGSREFSHATAHGEGVTLEALSRLPVHGRPQALVSYPNWWSRRFPMGMADWMVRVRETSITSGTELGRFPIDWAAIDRGGRVPVSPGVGLLLDMDVADLESERLNVYTCSRGPYDASMRSWPQPLAPVGVYTRPALLAGDPASTRTVVLDPGGPAVDGGRVVRGESFRFAPDRFPANAAKLVIVGGTPPDAECFFPVADALWISIVSNTTGHAVRREVSLAGSNPSVLEADMRGVFDEAGGTGWTIRVEASPPGGAWASYHYWLLSSVDYEEDAGQGPASW